jgi:hypothetical protein
MAINFPDSPTSGDTHTVGDKTWTWNGTSWDVVVSTPISNQIIDADGDTRIHVEESPDEDYIRFDTAGTERMTIGPTGDVAVANDLSVTGTISGGSTSFPTSLDSGTMPAIEALQAKVGADSSAVTSSLDYKIAQLESDVAGFTSGKILQIVRATDTVDRSTTSTTAVDAGISVTITPTSATSDILILWTHRATIFSGSLNRAEIVITDSSNVELSGTQGNIHGVDITSSVRVYNTLIAYDSPATTSATTYKGRFNRSGAGNLTLQNGSTTGQMIALEIGA